MKVIDMHCDTIMALMNKSDRLLRKNDCHVDIEKMRDGDYLCQCFAMFVPLKKVDNPFEYVNLMIDKYYTELEKNKDLIQPAFSYTDILNNQKENKMSAILTIEEGAVTNLQIPLLRNLYRLGVRMITLTWNYENGIGFPNIHYNNDGKKPDFLNPNKADGLTDYGIKMIKEMERLGIIIDVSHLSDAGFYDVLKYTKKPFVASHSNSRSVCNIVRNLTDDMIVKLAQRGGVMGINYCNFFVNQEGIDCCDKTKVSDLVRHIKYIKNLAGIDCIGLGSDFDGIDNNLEMNDASKLRMLEEELYKNNFTKEEVEKIFYKNVLRVFKEVLK